MNRGGRRTSRTPPGCSGALVLQYQRITPASEYELRISTWINFVRAAPPAGITLLCPKAFQLVY